jgi:uncharacterized protein
LYSTVSLRKACASQSCNIGTGYNARVVRADVLRRAVIIRIALHASIQQGASGATETGEFDAPRGNRSAAVPTGCGGNDLNYRVVVAGEIVGEEVRRVVLRDIKVDFARVNASALRGVV